MKLMNYSIIQRDDDGFARFVFDGDLPEGYDGERIVTRVIREEDNLVVLNWQECRIDNGKWMNNLVIPEGGLYRIEAMFVPKGSSANWGRRIRCLYHVGVGDIYITAGQSNMTGYGRDIAVDPPQLGVHAYYNYGSWDVAAHPLGCAAGSLYDHCDGSSETSPALSFGRHLANHLHIPIGLIPAAIGGSPLKVWKPDEDAWAWKQILDRLETVGKVKGIIWSQGCTDANPNDAEGYYDRFKKAVELWREALGDVPVLTIQANRGAKTDDPDGIDGMKWWGIVRDAQRKAALTIPGVYCVPAYDLPTSDGIHNASGSNVILGERLANAALVGIYGQLGRTPVAVVNCEWEDETHVRVNLTPDHPMAVMDGTAYEMIVEDEEGTTDCVSSRGDYQSLIVETARPYKLPAKFSFSWRIHPAMFFPREQNGMPLLTCYGVEIEMPKD